MALETKVILLAILRIIKQYKDLDEAYEAFVSLLMPRVFRHNRSRKTLNEGNLI